MTAPDIIAVLHNLPPTTYETIAVAVVIPTAIELFKKWLVKEQQNPKTAWVYVVISTTLAFLASLGQYLDTGGAQNWTVLGQHTVAVLGAIQLAYHFPKVGIKALSQTTADAKLTKPDANLNATANALAGAATGPVLENEFSGR